MCRPFASDGLLKPEDGPTRAQESPLMAPNIAQKRPQERSRALQTAPDWSPRGDFERLHRGGPNWNPPFFDRYFPITPQAGLTHRTAPMPRFPAARYPASVAETMAAVVVLSAGETTCQGGRKYGHGRFPKYGRKMQANVMPAIPRASYSTGTHGPRGPKIWETLSGDQGEPPP